jgi:Na(+)-translocating NADH:ubiquinone oxidoreductase B subunit
MKALAAIFDRLRPAFEEGGRLARLRPLFEATENFFLATPRRTMLAPHVRDPLDVKRYMMLVIIGLAPCTAAAIYFFGWRVLALILVSYAVGGAVEVAIAIWRQEDINEGLLVTGLLFPLILPPGLPLWLAGLGIAFGVIVGKELFGGTGRNPFNPALVGRCFLAIAYPTATASNWIAPAVAWPGRLTEYVSSATLDAVSKATPLSTMGSADATLLADLFWGTTSGSAGETSAACILLGAVILLLTGVANWRSIVATLGSFALLAAVLHRFMPDDVGPPLWELLAGSILFGAVFMATDPITGPITSPAKWAYGVIIGVSALLIRRFSGFPEGVTFAILLGNIAAPVLDEVCLRVHVRRLRGVT